MVLIERLRARQWRLSAQRRVIAEVLSGPSLHLTAEEVTQRARAALPEISVATVYNTLNELVGMGELREIDGIGRLRRYDPNTVQPHHHLVCVGCDRILDVFPEEDFAGALEPSERHGFEVHRADVLFSGRCPGCREG
ncbi:MAG: transcriptional repressor [Myxococcota bacterium]